LYTEIYLKILKYLESNPEASQRKLAQELGVSVGKINYCLKALINKGFMKAGNCKRNTQKLRYLYLLTPSGVEENVCLTFSFLKRQIVEYDKITQQIEQLKQDIVNK
jgi:EPS-associated MarR family transcriptional regulator